MRLRRPLITPTDVLTILIVCGVIYATVAYGRANW